MHNKSARNAGMMIIFGVYIISLSITWLGYEIFASIFNLPSIPGHYFAGVVIAIDILLAKYCILLSAFIFTIANGVKND
jgi:hypothetical protein